MPVMIAWDCWTVTEMVDVVVIPLSVPFWPAPTQVTRQLMVAETRKTPPGAFPDDVR